MIKKLEKAVKDLEQRTGSRLAINDYDCDDCGGMQRMTFPGAKYARYGVMRHHTSTRAGTRESWGAMVEWFWITFQHRQKLPK